MIGKKINKPITDYKSYAETATWCNNNNAHMEDKGAYYEVVENSPAPKPTIEEQLIMLENDYQMNRWQREGILAEGSLYSDYTKAKAQELEDLAEQIRHQDDDSDSSEDESSYYDDSEIDGESDASI